jgi:hypothetical protein
MEAIAIFVLALAVGFSTQRLIDRLDLLINATHLMRKKRD